MAEEKFNQIISQNPEVEIPSIYQMAFQIEKSKRNTKAAINTLQKAITTFPNHESLKIRLAREFFNTGKLPESEELCRQILERNDQMTHAHILLGNVNLRLNKIKAKSKNKSKLFILCQLYIHPTRVLGWIADRARGNTF